jgi:TonB family protein
MRQITCGAACRGRKLLLVLNMLIMLMFASVVPSAAQDHDQVANERKLTTRIEPDYPEALKRLYIGGVVRVEVHVTPSGTVESTELIGGNPILGQSAMKAVKQWRYVPAKAKETLTVKIEFDPHR